MLKKSLKIFLSIVARCEHYGDNELVFFRSGSMLLRGVTEYCGDPIQGPT